MSSWLLFLFFIWGVNNLENSTCLWRISTVRTSTVSFHWVCERALRKSSGQNLYTIFSPQKKINQTQRISGPIWLTLTFLIFFAEAYYKGSWVSLSLTPYQESSHGCWTHPKEINLEWKKLYIHKIWITSPHTHTHTSSISTHWRVW